MSKSDSILVVPCGLGGRGDTGGVGFYCQKGSEPIDEYLSQRNRSRIVELAPGEKTIKMRSGVIPMAVFVWWWRIKNVNGKAVIRAWPRPLPRT